MWSPLRKFSRYSLFLVLLCSLFHGQATAEALTAGDRQTYRVAFAAAHAGRWTAASREAAGAHDPVLRKVLHWLDLMHGDSNQFSEITAFIQQNPDWPGQTALRQRAEQALTEVSDAVLADWFQRHPPVTPYGKLKQAEMMMDAGQREAAIAQIREVWATGTLSAFDESSVLQRFPGIIRSEDHIKRLDRLLWEGQSDAARHLLPRVPVDWQLLADARLKLQDMKPGVEGAVARVPAHLLNDPGFLHDRVRWRRHKEFFDEAIETILTVHPDAEHAQAWWTERQLLLRHVLTQGDAKLAYRLASQHGLGEGPALTEAEFLSGWIALHFLKNPAVAYDHFVRLYDSARMPISHARGAFWAGRAAETMGYDELAGAWFQTASQDPTTYYGQLAIGKLGGEPALRPAATRDPIPTAEEQTRFNRRELVRAAEMLPEIGQSERLPAFLHCLSDNAKSASEHVMIAALAESLGRPELSVAAAKRASYAGFPLVTHGYPLLALPPAGGAERPLVLAIARQESAFDFHAVSPVGARGLMQLMPATAHNVAKGQRMAYSASRLTTDPRYNLQLGGAYLGSLIDDFSGSYILAIAAYNAGPARVRQWMQEFGDPRGKGTDAVDWVESIPFNETRNYVQRVLENLQIYRLRLGDHRLAFSLAVDLRR